MRRDDKLKFVGQRHEVMKHACENRNLPMESELLAVKPCVGRPEKLLRISLLLLIALSLSYAAVANPATRSDKKTQKATAATVRDSYDINFKLDFDNRTYTGTERIRWTNRGSRPTALIYLHLYANMRSAPMQESDEPRIDVTEVRDPESGALLNIGLEDQSTTLRINLRSAVAVGASADVLIAFRGSVPEIDPEETGILAHIVQQVAAVLRREREVRRARDINFSCRGVVMLGAAYPILAARDDDDWQKKVESSIGDAIHAEAADYRVTVESAPGVAMYTSGVDEVSGPGAAPQVVSIGQGLRSFAIAAGRNLRVEARQVGEITVRSVYLVEHELVGRRVLGIASEAVQIYNQKFGALPYKQVTVAEAPLVAGLGCIEFSGLSGIAGAYYLDFDSPSMRRLPEVVREQRASVEGSLEWTVAHAVAQQWWGGVVGNDPERDPVLDEALSNWSALFYFREAHGEEQAAMAMEDQLRGVYKIYRTFGGEDMTADRAARDYRNFFQYAAIVSSKGALMFAELHKLLGDVPFFAALSRYFKSNTFEIAKIDDLREVFIEEAPAIQKRAVARLFDRWLSGKRGDQDIAPPDPQLARALGINQKSVKNGDRNALARLGRFFWQQMTRLR